MFKSQRICATYHASLKTLLGSSPLPLYDMMFHLAKYCSDINLTLHQGGCIRIVAYLHSKLMLVKRKMIDDQTLIKAILPICLARMRFNRLFSTMIIL